MDSIDGSHTSLFSPSDWRQWHGLDSLNEAATAATATALATTAAIADTTAAAVAAANSVTSTAATQKAVVNTEVLFRGHPPVLFANGVNLLGSLVQFLECSNFKNLRFHRIYCLEGH